MSTDQHADADKTRTRTLAVTSDESRVEGHVWKLVIVERANPTAGVDDWRFDRYELWRIDLHGWILDTTTTESKIAYEAFIRWAEP